MFSNLPPGLLGDMLNDPPGFDRSTMPGVGTEITAFFSRHLLPAGTPTGHAGGIKPPPVP